MYDPKIAAWLTIKKGIGAGQLYNEEFGKALMFWVLGAVVVFIGALTYWIGLFIGGPLLYVWAIIDAYKTAKRKNMELYGGRRE